MRGQSTTNKMFKVMANTFIDNAHIQLQQTDHIKDGFFASVFSVPFEQDMSFTKLNKAIIGLTDKKFEIEANSVYKVDDNVYRCILSSTTESVPYTEIAVKEMGLESVRANLFIDPDNEVLWRVEGDGENRRLVQNSQSDFGALLESKRTRTSILASDRYTTPYEEHDYAYFFNHEALAMDFGYVVSRGTRDYIFSRRHNKLVPLVTATQVVVADQPEALKHPGRQKNKMVLSADYAIDSYLDYLRQMYGSDNPYYQAWEKQIKEHAVN